MIIWSTSTILMNGKNKEQVFLPFSCSIEGNFTSISQFGGVERGEALPMGVGEIWKRSWRFRWCHGNTHRDRERLPFTLGPLLTLTFTYSLFLPPPLFSLFPSLSFFKFLPIFHVLYGQKKGNARKFAKRHKRPTLKFKDAVAIFTWHTQHTKKIFLIKLNRSKLKFFSFIYFYSKRKEFYASFIIKTLVIFPCLIYHFRGW